MVKLDPVYEDAIRRIRRSCVISHLRREAMAALVEREFPLAPDHSKVAITAGLEALWDRDRQGGRGPTEIIRPERARDPDVDRLR